MQGGGATRQGHGVRDTDPTRQLRLEEVDVRTERCDPTGVEGLEDHAALLVTDVGG